MTDFRDKLICGLFALLLFSCSAEKPDHVGLKDGKLQPCPESPNCVQSFDSSDEDHFMDPLPLKNSDPKATMEAVASTIKSLPRTEIIEQTDEYLHVTFTTAVFRFIDDVEFLITEDELHFRSSSRLGHYDLGVNKRRMTSFRKEYEKL